MATKPPITGSRQKPTVKPYNDMPSVATSATRSTRRGLASSSQPSSGWMSARKFMAPSSHHFVIP